MSVKTTQALWQDYSFLTKEMLKFLDKQDMELFYELMDQRERLQTIIEETPDEGFKLSSPGQSLLFELKKDNELILNNLQAKQSRAKRHHQVSEVYTGASTPAISRMNWER